MDLKFLKSPRFYAIVIGALSVYLQQKGIFGDAEMMLIATITTAFTIVGTADSIAKKVAGN